jgi:hypothetical protein
MGCRNTSHFFVLYILIIKQNVIIMEEITEQAVSRGLNANPVYQQQKSYPFPTEIISLPSKGLVYPENSPLAKGEITVKLMTAKEEDILTSTNLIRKGVVIDKLLESIIVEPGVSLSDLIIGDKNAILIATRVLAYGPEYNVTVTDPAENEPVQTKVDMSKLSIKEVNENLLNRQNEYEFTLPQSKTLIKFKLLTHGDEVAINKDIEAFEKTLKEGKEVTTRLRRLILEVEGNRDLGFISNYVVNQLRAADSRALRKYIQQITPDIDLSFDYESPFTGEREALRVPIGLDFFYPTE